MKATTIANEFTHTTVVLDGARQWQRFGRAVFLCVSRSHEKRTHLQVAPARHATRR